MSERLKEVMARVFEVPVARIDFETSQENLDEWTSLSHLRLITELESELGVQLTMQDAIECTSLRKLAERLATDRG